MIQCWKVRHQQPTICWVCSHCMPSMYTNTYTDHSYSRTSRFRISCTIFGPIIVHVQNCRCGFLYRVSDPPCTSVEAIVCTTLWAWKHFRHLAASIMKCTCTACMSKIALCVGGGGGGGVGSEGGSQDFSEMYKTPTPRSMSRWTTSP